MIAVKTTTGPLASPISVHRNSRFYCSVPSDTPISHVLEIFGKIFEQIAQYRFSRILQRLSRSRGYYIELQNLIFSHIKLCSKDYHISLRGRGIHDHKKINNPKYKMPQLTHKTTMRASIRIIKPIDQANRFISMFNLFTT